MDGQSIVGPLSRDYGIMMKHTGNDDEMNFKIHNASHSGLQARMQGYEN